MAAPTGLHTRAPGRGCLPHPRRGIPARMVIFKRPGERTRFRFLPGCLVWSLVLSVGLTILINVLIRLF